MTETDRFSAAGAETRPGSASDRAAPTQNSERLLDVTLARNSALPVGAGSGAPGRSATARRAAGVALKTELLAYRGREVSNFAAALKKNWDCAE